MALNFLNNGYFASNVGIGTTSPNAKLDVQDGHIRNTNDNTGNFLDIFCDGDGTGSSIFASSANNIVIRPSNGFLDLQANGFGASGSHGNLRIFNSADAVQVSLNSSGNSYLNGGNVGIGTTSPNARLKVISSTSSTDIHTVDIQHIRNNPDVGTHAMRINMDLSGADNTTADRVNSGLLIDLDSSANGDGSNEHRIRGLNTDVRFTGFSDLVWGGGFSVKSVYTGAKTSQMIGARGQATHNVGATTGGVSNMYGVFGNSVIQNLGDVDNAFGGYFDVSLSALRGNANFGVSKGVEGHINIDKAETVNYGEMMAVSGIIDNNEGTVPNFGNQYLFKGAYQGTKGGNAYGIYCGGDKHYFDGNVGIGTTSPVAKLDVSVASGNAWMNLINGSETAFRLTTYNNGTGSGSSAYAFKHGLYYSSTENAAVTFYRGNSSTGGFLTFTTNNGSERMRIDSAGNVGIGTTDPDSKLDVRGAGSGEIARFTTLNGSDSYIYIGRDDSTSEGLTLGYNSSNGDCTIKSINGSHPIVFEQGTNERMRIASNGDVGIGHTDPLHKLSIESGGDTTALLKLRQTTNGNGAAIEFNDNGTSAGTQNGTITYYHSDSASQGGGSSYWLRGQDDQTLVLANNGRVVVQKSGSTAEVGYGFYDDINTGMYRIAADNLGFATAGVKRLDINGSSATFSGNLTISGGNITLLGTGRITGIDTVTALKDATSKSYVDSNFTAKRDLENASVWFNVPGTASTLSPRNDGYWSSSSRNIRYTTFQANFDNLTLESGYTYYLVISRYKKGGPDGSRSSDRTSNYKIPTAGHAEAPYAVRPTKLQITSLVQNFDFRPDLYYTGTSSYTFPRPSGYKANAAFTAKTSRQNFAFRIQRVTNVGGAVELSKIVGRLGLLGDRSGGVNPARVQWKTYQ